MVAIIGSGNANVCEHLGLFLPGPICVLTSGGRAPAVSGCRSWGASAGAAAVKRAVAPRNPQAGPETRVISRKPDYKARLWRRRPRPVADIKLAVASTLGTVIC